MQHSSAAAVIVAAGSSQRMAGQDKLWTPLAGRLTLARTVDVFEASPVIGAIVLVVNTSRTAEANALSKTEGWRKIIAIVPGGPRRQDSVKAGLDTLSEIDPHCRSVMIHDGGRPLVTTTILAAGLEAAQRFQAAIAAVPVKDTIKQAQDQLVVATLDRSQLWAIQTPQVFSFPLIHQAHLSPTARDDITDDAALLERLGHPVAIFPGAYTNIKITTQEDLLIAEAFIRGNIL